MRARAAIEPECEVDDIDSNRLTATFALASRQVEKMKLGANHTMTAFFDNCLVVHAVDDAGWIISLLARPDANVGMISALIPDIKQFLKPLGLKLQGKMGDLQHV